jgi:dTDP-glucose pyrophosphorylase/CBS domain-containing protein
MNTRMDIDKVSVDGGTPILEVISQMNASHTGISLVIDEKRKLIGTVTDGDLRRALAENIDLDQPVLALLSCQSGHQFEHPLVADRGKTDAEYIALLKKYRVHHLPIIDEEGRVENLVTLNELIPEQDLTIEAVVMAGGKGTRLKSLTEEIPKPMLPVGGRPLLEHIIEHLREMGVRRVNVTTHYKSEKIMEHFGDGSRFGVELNYVNENTPLGTAGSLGIMDKPQDAPLLVINGDILTKVDFKAMLAFHRKQEADLTIGVRKLDIEVPYGVVDCEGVDVIGLKEKPKVNFLVNAGIYFLEPKVYDFINNGESLDMPQLIQRLLNVKLRVVNFLIMEYWLDIGQLSDYRQAQEDIQDGAVLR